MARMIVGSLILSKNRRMLIEIFPASVRKLWNEWEMRLIVLLSLTFQIILMLLGNRRRSTRNLLLQITLWIAYFAADSVAAFALGVISSDLNDAAPHTGTLQASLELEAFWTPFFLLHLGGVDTITALSVEDNELWIREALNFVLRTGMVIYILQMAWSGSHLSILSILILVAGIINYGERIYALWCASYEQRKKSARRGRIFTSKDEHSDDKQPLVVAKYTVTRRITECLFADVLPEGVPISDAFRHAMGSWKTGMELVELWLALMYDSIYTKAKVSHFALGAATRCICLLLTCISLVMFCGLNNQEKHSKIDVSITFALLIMAVLKEFYGAFVFLTSYTTLGWLWGLGRDVQLQAMKPLSSLRTARWSNSMGQYSLISFFLREKPSTPPSKVMKLVNYILDKNEVKSLVYERPVKDYVKEGIHQYLNQAKCKYERCKYSISNSKGRVPLEVWKIDRIHHGGANVDPTSWLNFGLEIGEIVVRWHIVTEVCYYLDFNSLTIEEKDNPIYLNWKISKYLSRYLMHLYVVSSDMLRGALSQERFDNIDYNDWRTMFGPQRHQAGTSNPEPERSEHAAHHEQEKRRRRRARVQACWNFWGPMRGLDYYWMTPTLLDAHKLMKALMNDDPNPQANVSKLERNWKLLSEVWIELLASAANQCRGNQHAQHLRQGGELLTYAWILLGYFGLTELLVPSGHAP